jgi:hypothetical protein
MAGREELARNTFIKYAGSSGADPGGYNLFKSHTMEFYKVRTDKT